MTLEEAAKTWPAKLGFYFSAKVLRLASFFQPDASARLAKKLRGLFSTRMNNILHENLFVYGNVAQGVCVTTRDVSCNTGIELHLQLDLTDYIQGHFFFGGLPDFFLDLLSFSNNETVFFDLGANMGIISASLAKFMPHHQIIAVEAMPETYQRMKRVFDSNCPSAKAYNTALSSSRGTLRFNIPSTDSGSSSASLSANELVDARNPDVYIQTDEVKCERFDDFFRRLDASFGLSKFKNHAFKIDVEGHECEVLEGMREYFDSYKGEILLVVEVRRDTAAKAHAILSTNGFSSKNSHSSAESLDICLRDCIYLRPAI